MLFRSPFNVGDFKVTAEKIANIQNVVTTSDAGADGFYRVKHFCICLDDKTGKDKKTPEHLIFQAASVDDARERYRIHVKDYMCDVELAAVSETKYLDYFPYNN